MYRAFSAGVFVDPSAEAERICQLVLDIVDKRQSVSDDGEAVPELISDDGDSAAAGYGAGAGLGAGLGAGAAGGLAGAGAGLGSRNDVTTGAGGLAGAGAGLGSRSGHTTGAGAGGLAGAGATGERPVPPPPGLSSSAAGVSSAGQGASAASAHSAAAAGQGSEGANGAGQGAVGTNAAGAGDGAGAGNARERDVRPPIAQGLPLQAYSDDQLDDLVSWIRSDGIERSEDEEVEQLRETLALKRRGTTVDAVLHHAVKRGRS